jgi:tetratricopeptide (TPR) repeat protein
MLAQVSGRRALLHVVAAAAICSMLAPAARAQMRDSIPSQAYYTGVEQFYQGNYRDAARTFDRAGRSSIKTIGPSGQVRWIDSICYHAMLGETYYQMGQNDLALQQFDAACSVFLQYPRWLLRVQFDGTLGVSSSISRNVPPWGGASRQVVPGTFPESYGVAQGAIDNSQAVARGGVVQNPELWSVNVVEVIRCTILAIRRRNEILGPLGPYDSISKNMVLQLSRGGAPPNHWSQAWVDIERGYAHAGVGENEQALQALQQGTLVGGQFDHPLTGLALLEQGRLALDAGNVGAAGQLINDASSAGFMFHDVGVIDEAFRWAAINHLASGAQKANPAFVAAAAWARREHYNQISARINLAMAEQLLAAGDRANAAVALAAGESQLADARNGRLGNVAMFLEAKLDYASGRPTGAAKLNTAIEGQAAISLQNYQINRANSMFDAQTLPSRSAPSVYEILLADPTPADAVIRLLESMAVMSTQHDAAFARWLVAAMDRGNMPAALEVTDRAKRRRFHNMMPWGGRLAALRDLLAAPPTALNPHQQQLRDDLLARFGDFAAASASVEDYRSQLLQVWLPALDDDGRRKVASLWKELTAAMTERELRLGQIGLSPVPAEISFPPLLTAADLQAKLLPGQALLVYHDTPGGLVGFLITTKAATNWNCGPTGRVATLVADTLREMGNYDANRELTAETLLSDGWQASSDKLAKMLLEGSSLSPQSIKELIIVPDGVVWYAPFEALVVDVNGQKTPLISLTKIRYAPTIGLAFSSDGGWRRIQRTGLVLGKMIPGEKADERAEAAASLTAAIPSPYALAMPSEAPSPVIASVLDALVVIDDVDASGLNPFAWSPLPIDRSAQVGALDQWLAIPGVGPQRILLPGMHTLAERGGKAPRNKDSGPPGSDLFYASCSLMSAGAETMLLSRWRVGGQSTLDIVREFIQELPHAAAADAWQRSVQLTMESPIDPAAELRVKQGKGADKLTGKHPFFWAGYLVVDSGWRPAEETPADPAAEPVVAPAAGGAPAAPAPGAVAPPAGGAMPPAEGAGGAGGPPPPPTPPGTAPPVAPAPVSTLPAAASDTAPAPTAAASGDAK